MSEKYVEITPIQFAINSIYEIETLIIKETNCMSANDILVWVDKIFDKDIPAVRDIISEYIMIPTILADLTSDGWNTRTLANVLNHDHSKLEYVLKTIGVCESGEAYIPLQFEEWLANDTFQFRMAHDLAFLNSFVSFRNDQENTKKYQEWCNRYNDRLKSLLNDIDEVRNKMFPLIRTQHTFELTFNIRVK